MFSPPVRGCETIYHLELTEGDFVTVETPGHFWFRFAVGRASDQRAAACFKRHVRLKLGEFNLLCRKEQKYDNIMIHSLFSELQVKQKY